MSGKKPPNKTSKVNLSESSRAHFNKQAGSRLGGFVNNNDRLQMNKGDINRKQSNSNQSRINRPNSNYNQSRTSPSNQRSAGSATISSGRDTRQIRSKSLFDILDATFGGKLYIILASIVLVFILGITLWSFTKKNAYEVYLDDKVIGVIQMNKKITDSIIYDTAVKKLASDIGSNVKVHETVTFKSKHASKKDFVTVEHVTSEIYKKFTYDIEASAITVDEKTIGFVKSKEEADAILEDIKKQYIRPDSSTTAEFVENLKVTPQFIPSEQVSTSDTIKSALMSVVDEEQVYTVKSGDTLWSIAQNEGMTVDQLIQINPSLTGNNVLQINQELTVVRQKPIVSVKTIEEVTYIDVERYQREVQQNYNEKKSYSKVIQQGKDGQKEVVSHITRINGFEIPDGRKVISENVTVQPITEIIEVGTK